MYRIVTTSTTLFLTIALLTGCAGYRPYEPPPPVPDDRFPVEQPAFRGAPNDFTDGFNQQFVLQGEQFVDLSRHIRNVKGEPKEAYNADAFGEVRNSTWFTNRNARRRMSIEEIVRGADTGSGPDTSANWTIIRAKAEGVTPGFTVIDGRGEKYVIKFDPIGYAGLNSGAEVIGSKLFYAAGYNVPENYITYFHPRILKLGDEVSFTDEKGRDRFMHEGDLADMLARVEVLPSGLIRATASKYLAGIPLGPFRYEKTRRDDPNDFVPHHHRRELRGLRVMAAWLNHIDSKAANSMDMFIGENGRGYVKHYLIDFGTILGSGGRGPQPIYRGHENELDPHALMLRVLSLGLYNPGWERVGEVVEYPCIGRYSADYYHPQKFKIIFPNPAYDNLTSQDGYWGAKLVMSFTDEQLQAVVEQAQYPDPAGAAYLLQHLIARRDITGRYWFTRVAPLDEFALVDTKEGGQKLVFTDLGIATGLFAADQVSYAYELRREGDVVFPEVAMGPRNTFPLPHPGEGFEGDTKAQWELTIRVEREGAISPSKWVKVYLISDAEGFEMIGIERQG